LTAKPTSELAEFFSALTYDDIPRDVRDYVKDIILDTFASAIAGRRGDETLQIQALAEAIGGSRRQRCWPDRASRSPGRRCSTATRSPR
jgi:2-methylcitrate dehydratase PrpD